MNQCITSLVVDIISMNILYSTCGLSFWPIQKAFPTQSGQCPSVVTDTCEYLSIPRALTMVRCFWEEPHLESTIRTWPPSSCRLKWSIPSPWESLSLVTRACENLSGQYPDSEGLELVKPTHFNLSRECSAREFLNHFEMQMRLILFVY